MKDLPSQEELDAAWEEVKRIHRIHLARHGVKLPRANSCKRVWLSMLYHFRDREVHKDEISDAVRREFPDAARDQQVRHLKRDGWNIETGKEPGSHRLDPYTASPTLQIDQARRRAVLHDEDFNERKIAFGFRCATCGASEGEPDPRYGGDKVELQQGHRDPHKPSDDHENIIPQCANCNRAYKDHFVFDEKGRVRAVASVDPVKRASKSVRRKIFEFLKNQLGEC